MKLSKQQTSKACIVTQSTASSDKQQRHQLNTITSKHSKHDITTANLNQLNQSCHVLLWAMRTMLTMVDGKESGNIFIRHW